jgi:RNA polymerase sigma factor (TIGR02999 family)
MTVSAVPVTDLLREWVGGKPENLDHLLPVLYDPLHRIAARELRRESGDHTLQPTALVNEAYLKLRDIAGVSFASRNQFLGFAAHLIRRILVDHARRKQAQKRGSAGVKVSLLEADAVAWSRPPDLVALDDALMQLSALDPRKRAVVELRFFGGLSAEEIAVLLETSAVTVHREWRRARAWLLREMQAS